MGGEQNHEISFVTFQIKNKTTKILLRKLVQKTRKEKKNECKLILVILQFECIVICNVRDFVVAKKKNEGKGANI